MQLHLAPGERVLKVGRGTRSVQGQTATGVVCLTTLNVMFVSSNGQETIGVPDIVAIRPVNTLGVLPTGFAIELRGAIELRFVVAKRNEWIALFERVAAGDLAGIPSASEVEIPDAGPVGPIEPIVSWPAYMAWIAAPFALIPLVGLLPALVVLVASGMLLFKPKRRDDKRIGVVFGVISLIAIVALGIEWLSALTQGSMVSSPPATQGMHVSWASRIASVVVLIFSIIVHECGHALAAYWGGDQTSVKLKRLTLNPIPHIDIMGSLVLPGILIISGSSILFGWAKPVPINLGNLRNRWWGNMAVSLAGVSANLALAGAALTLLAILGAALHFFAPNMMSVGFWMPFYPTQLHGVALASVWAVVADVLKMAVLLNLALMVFNLLPVPPLDGSHILELLLPRGLKQLYAKVRNYGFIILVLLIFTGVTGKIISAAFIAGAGLCWLVGAVCGLN